MTERLDPYEIFAEDEIRVTRFPAAEGAPASGQHEQLSAADRQRTCAACGGAFEAGQRTELEVLLDGGVRYVAVHAGHTTYSPAREQEASTRLRAIGVAPPEKDERAA